MKEYNKLILDGASDIVITELGNRVLYGMNWLLLLKNNSKDMDKYERYLVIRNEADKEGFKPEECFRVYETVNGFVMDIEQDLVNIINTKLVEILKDTSPELAHLPSDIYKKMKERQSNEKKRLSSLIIKKAKNNELEFEVALFSKNIAGKINVECLGQNNQHYLVRYDAFSITAWDIESINRDILIDKGYLIDTVQVCDILPNKRGVRTKLYIKKLF